MRRRLPEEGPVNAGAGPGLQASASGQWRERVREQPPRRDLPEATTAPNQLRCGDTPSPNTAAIRDASSDLVQMTTQMDRPAIRPAEQPITTKAGKARQRMIWTTEMNRHVMWCYYTASKLETITLYRAEMRRLFLLKLPGYTHVSEQRLIDQKRVIINNNRLSHMEREDIKRQVAEYLECRDQRSPTQNTDTPETWEMNIGTQGQQTTQETEGSDDDTGAGTQINTSVKEDEIEATLRENLETNLTRWNGSNPTKRARLPKLHLGKETLINVARMNGILSEYTHNTQSLEELHTLIYCAASAVVSLNNQRAHVNILNNTMKRKPSWQIRIETKIEMIRRDIGKTTQYITGNRSRKVTNRIDQLMSIYHETPIETLDTLKQRLAVYSTRLRRYKESQERKTQNHIFHTSQKRFYQGLNRENNIKIVPPAEEEIEAFWQNIWSTPVLHNERAPWIDEEKRRHTDIPEQAEYMVTCEELQQIINRTHNWKTPGSDNIHNFWYKKFTSTHNFLTKYINLIIRNPTECPDFLMEGTTYIKPKNSDTQNPANYRPITCLQTLYKIITSTITHKIDLHLSEHAVLSEEQKGCKRGSQGCKEQLIIDTIIMKQVEKEQRNIHTSYIDYKKAYDSVPHSWLKAVLDIYKINPDIRNFLTHAMTKWKTTIHLTTDTKHVQTRSIKIDRGIFQGDSLSALWFCMCLNPLSNTLNNTTFGFNIKHRLNIEHKINHLLYMDDIKIYAPTPTQLRNLLHILEKISKDIGMEFGLSKCKILHIDRGKWVPQEDTETLNCEVLDNMQQAETYKYLGFQQNTRIDHANIKKELTEKYKKRLSTVLKTRLNSRNIFKAINSYAIPLLTYSFGIIKWSQTELEGINRLNRTQLTKQRKLHPNSCIERINISRKEGGRGLIDVTALHERQINDLRKYFHSKDTALHRAVVKVDRNYTPLNLIDNQEIQSNHTIEKKKESWAQKALHGKHPAIMLKENIVKHVSYSWLQKGELMPETEGFLLAIQDQVIPTRNYRKYIIKESGLENDKCRRCYQFQETIDHITGGCKMLAGVEYTERHNNAAKIIHYEIAKQYGLAKGNTPYYKYSPESVLENERVRLYWDRTIHTDKTITCNRPDITLIKKNTKETYLIDIAIPNDTNIAKKEEEKREKYHPLALEVQELWEQKKVTVIPLVISVTGITPYTFMNGLKTLQIPEHTHANIQKAVILKTCSIVRKFLNQ